MITATQTGSLAGALLKSLAGGIVVGVVSLLALYGAQSAGWLAHDTSPVQQVVLWCYDNLKGSIGPFLLVLLVFLMLVDRLGNQLKACAPLESISQTDYLADLCTSLFFGIGVIWTAIGMRSALLAGLGNLDDSAAAAEVGAFKILKNLVDGGILLALSTTIIGGVGGYFMRIFKGIRTGAMLRQRYVADSHASEQAVLQRLDALNETMLAMRLPNDLSIESDYAQRNNRAD